MTTELALFNVAKETLAECRRVDEVQDVRDRAERMRLYGQQVKDRSIVADATEVILRAERRLGELLKAAKEVGQLGVGRRRSNLDDNGAEEEPFPRVTLEEIGISKKDSAKAQKLASVPDAAFEEAVQASREEVLSGAAWSVNPLKKVTTADKKARRAEREAELGRKIMALPEAKFGVIYADPEWRFKTYGEGGMDRAADNHYPTSDLETIKSRDVGSLAADDCVLFLWATVPMLPEALAVMAEWGFKYVSGFAWDKGENWLGNGYWNRNQHEHLLIGTRGNVVAPAQGTQSPSIIRELATDHSVKPQKAYEIIEAYYPTVPKIELNARKAREGWARWGYEAPEENSGQVAASGPVEPCDEHGDGNGFRLKGDATFAQPGVGARESDALAEASGTSQCEDSASPDLPNPPLTPLDIDAILRRGDAEAVSLTDLMAKTGLTRDQIKKRRQKLGLASRDKQRAAVAESNRRRAGK